MLEEELALLKTYQEKYYSTKEGEGGVKMSSLPPQEMLASKTEN